MIVMSCVSQSRSAATTTHAINTTNITLTQTELNVHQATLTAGTYWTSGQTQDITIIFYKDGTNIQNLTVTYINALDQTDFLNLEKLYIPTTLYNAYMVLIFIIIIAASSFAGHRTNNTTTGVTSFTILSLIASMLDPRFLWIVLISGIGLIGTILYKNQQSNEQWTHKN